jgi:DNA-binding HxlR family transcriptional regulator
MNKNCTVYKTMDFVGKKWTILILLEIYKSKRNMKRYSEIKNSIPDITPKVLSTRLKELEEKEMVTKKIDAGEFPISCEYSLTEQGIDFIKIVQKIKDWTLHWNVKNPECESRNCKKCEF